MMEMSQISGAQITTRAPVISNEYLCEQTRLHQDINYGVASVLFAPVVAQFMKRKQLTSLTDYGAGKKRLYSALISLGAAPRNYWPYDPVFPEYGPPMPSEFVCCIDVLEHVEEAYLPNVLSDLSTLVTRYGFFTVHLGPAIKTLSDGRNAHLIQRPVWWWLKEITDYFDVAVVERVNGGGDGVVIVVTPRREGHHEHNR